MMARHHPRARWRSGTELKIPVTILAHLRAWYDAWEVLRRKSRRAVTIMPRSASRRSLTRLEGVPRSTPIIHALILASGLIGARVSSRLLETKRTTIKSATNRTAEHILLIGSNRLSLLYIKFIRAYSPGLHRIVGVLDDRPAMIGRAIDGVRIIGPPDHLEPIVNEFAEHGIRISHAVVGGDPDMLSPATLPEIRRICDAHEIRLDFVPELIGLQRLQPSADAADTTEAMEPAVVPVPEWASSSYFVVKKIPGLVCDRDAACCLPPGLGPVWGVLGTVALWDVGSPIFFWQQRLGQDGRPFLLHKIRTLKPPFDWRGQKVSEAERLSAIGRLIRKCRFDEVAQLLNVLVGDMSLDWSTTAPPARSAHQPLCRSAQE
jgi:Bacterial sugar transferase